MSPRATRIRAEAQALRAKLETQGIERVDALAQECGFLAGAIEGLAEQLDAFKGRSVKASRGCQIAEVNDVLGTFVCEVEYVRGQRGKFSGPPESCYPDEPSSLSIIRVWINGDWIDAFDIIAPAALERWAETLCADFDEDAIDH